MSRALSVFSCFISFSSLSICKRRTLFCKQITLRDRTYPQRRPTGKDIINFWGKHRTPIFTKKGLLWIKARSNVTLWKYINKAETKLQLENVNVTLHGTICNDDFHRATQRCNIVWTLFRVVTTSRQLFCPRNRKSSRVTLPHFQRSIYSE